jgi:hypothetical protein
LEKQFYFMMDADWIISRRRFLGLTGTSVAGLVISPDLLAGSGRNQPLRFGMLSDITMPTANLPEIDFTGNRLQK